MSRVLRICPGVGGRKCGAFLSSFDRDPHPTCARCRGKICTKDMTCDFCVDWTPGQWELFDKKRTYKERKKSVRPSGSVPPAPRASPRAGTSSEVPQPGTSSSSFSRPSGGQDMRGGGSQGTPGVVFHGASSPPARPRSSERGGGSVSGLSSVVRERASVSSAPSGAGGGGVSRSRRTPPAHAASSVASPRSSQHALRRGELGEVSEDRSLARSSRVSRSSERETRKNRRAHSRLDSSRDRGRRPCSRSSSCSRTRGRERRRRSSSRSLSSRERSRSSDRSRSRRVRSGSRGDWFRSSDRYRSRRDRFQRDWSRSSDRYRSRRQCAHSPFSSGGSRARDPPRRPRDRSGLVGDHLSPLTVCGLRREDGEPRCVRRRTTLLLNGPSIRPGFLGNLRRRVGQLDRRRLALGRRVHLELDRPRNRCRLLPLLASLARRGRIARVRLPFPHPPEAPATPGVKVKEPGKSRPDGTTLPLKVGGCLAPHWRWWQAIGAETWVVTVLRDGYRVPFLDSPPPLSPTPVSFPMYRAGSLRAQALRQEIEGMLAKGAL